jgi:hypothetical protein
MMRKLIALSAAIALAGCSAAQQTSVEQTIAANAAKITAVCGDVLAVANSSETDIAAAIIPEVGQVQAAVKAGCGTADGIAAMAESASTIDWLGTAKTVMASKGAVLPPAIAPVPVAK